MAKLQPLNDKNRGEFKAIFSVPEHWTVEYAHFAFNEVRDGTHDSPKQFEGEGYPLVTSKNLKSYGLDFQNTKNISAEDHFEISKRSKVETGDILFSMIGTIGNVSIIEDKTDFSIKNVGLFRKSQSLLTEKFSYYWLKSNTYQSWLSSRERGGTQKFVSLGTLRESPILIAPLPEQKRIVEKLDEVLAQVDTIKARLDGIPNLLKRFRQSVLASAVSGKLTEEWREQNDNLTSMTAYLEALSVEREAEYHCSCEEAKAVGARKPRKPSCIDPNVFASPEWVEKFVPKLPDKWAVSCIGNIGQNNADSIVDGPFGASINVKTDYIESGVPVIRINNINPFKFDNENLKFISEEKFADLKRHNVKGGDLLLGKVGTIGNACIYPLGSEEAMLSTTGSTRIRVDTRVCVLKFAELYLNSQKAAFNNIASAAVQPFLNMKTIKSFPFIAPPISEQKEIVRLVDQYFAFADTIEAQVKKAQARVDNLTQSILAKAFRGELVPQNDDDEPAEVLLERIAKARKEAEALAKAAKKAGNKKA
ncbi:restriction endonuclease subunit S [Vibrio sp. C8]